MPPLLSSINEKQMQIFLKFKAISLQNKKKKQNSIGFEM